MNNENIRLRRARKTRAKIAELNITRLTVHRSNSNIYAQIIDDLNNLRNDVKYYTTALSSNVYLFDDVKMSFVQVHGGSDTIPDMLSRIDSQLVGKAFQ